MKRAGSRKLVVSTTRLWVLAMKNFCHAVALSLSLAVAPIAAASPTLTNFSDIWWTPSEAGSGYNVAQQADLMFLTFFVYGLNGQPVWYTAILVDQGAQSDGSTVFSGNLFQSSGSYFGGPYFASDFAVGQAGTATFRGTSTTTAVLTYSVNDVVVSKSIERQPLRSDNFTGSYVGGTSDITSACSLANRNGIVSEEHGNFTIAHVGSVMEIRSPGCTYTGSHSQLGQVSRFTGQYTCTNGGFGTISFFDLRVEPGGVSGRYTGNGSDCDFAGNIGLGRRK